MEEIEQTYIDNDECVNEKRAFATLEQRNEQKKRYYEETQKKYMKTSEYKDYQKQYHKEYNLKKKQLKKSKVQ
jgi:hypothetical protein